MTAGIVRNDRVRHAMAAELERCERGALIAGTRLVHPDMDGNSRVMCHVDRRERGAPIDTSEPARVAMGEHIEGLTVLLFRAGPEQLQAVLADAAAGLDIVIADGGGLAPCHLGADLALPISDGVADASERPALSDGRPPGLEQHV